MIEPPGAHSLDWTSETGQRLDALCDRFEAALKTGESIPLEAFLDDWQEPERSIALHELIALEVHHRRRQGLIINSENFLQRFPELDPAWLAATLEASLLGTEDSARKDSRTADETVHSVTASDNAETTADPVRCFGDYQLLEEIARGGMGVVYRARQISLNRIVALKVILTGQHASPAEVQRFQAEARNAAALDHPHIVPIYEVGQQQGQHYYTMKLIEGVCLAQDLPRLAEDPKAVARVLAQVARAVHHAHQAGVLHRDLKPANILLDRRGDPHVTDFGLAKRLLADQPQTLSGAVIGTPAYMAPEQAQGRSKRVTAAADVYALGAVLYQCLTGEPPFRGDTALEILNHVVSAAPVPPRVLNPKAPSDLQTICLHCLQKDPRQRYASAEALANDLECFLADAPIHARPAGLVERLWGSCRRKPALAALLVLACCTLAAILVLGVGGITNGARNISLPAPPDLAGLPLVFDDQFADPAKSVLLPVGVKPPTPETPVVLENGTVELFFDRERFVLRRLRHDRGGRYVWAFQNQGPCGDCACLVRCRFSGQGDVGWALVFDDGAQYAVAVKVCLDGSIEVAEVDKKEPKTLWNRKLATFRPPRAESDGEFATLLVTIQDHKLTAFMNGSAVAAPLLLDRKRGPYSQAVALWGSGMGEAQAEFTRFALWRLPGDRPVQ